MAERGRPANSVAQQAIGDTSAPLGLATVALLAVAVFRSSALHGAIHAYLLFLGLLAVWALARIISGVYPVTDDTPILRALRRPARASSRPEELNRMAATLRFAAGSGAEAHQRLRPPLREIAAHRLAVRRGIDLDADPEAAQAVLGPVAWELLRPDRPAPLRRGGRGLPPATLRAIVEALEKI